MNFVFPRRFQLKFVFNSQKPRTTSSVSLKSFCVSESGTKRRRGSRLLESVCCRKIRETRMDWKVKEKELVGESMVIKNSYEKERWLNRREGEGFHFATIFWKTAMCTRNGEVSGVRKKHWIPIIFGFPLPPFQPIYARETVIWGAEKAAFFIVVS